MPTGGVLLAAPQKDQKREGGGGTLLKICDLRAKIHKLARLRGAQTVRIFERFDS